MKSLILNGYYFGIGNHATFVCSDAPVLTEEMLEQVTEKEYYVARGSLAFDELKEDLRLNCCKAKVTEEFIAATPLLANLGIRSHVTVEGTGDVPFKMELTPRKFDNMIQVLYLEHDFSDREHDYELAV